MKKAILFIHGLSARKKDNEYFIKRMTDYKNVDIYTFTLPGHENDQTTLVNYQEWIEKSEKELKKLFKQYKKVVIVAHSMGSIIAVNLASRYDIEKLVLLSPAFIFGNPEQNRKDLANLLTNNINEKIGTGFEGVLKKISETPPKVFAEYQKMLRENIKNISKIKCPTLIMHGIEDNVISPKASKFVYERLNCQKDLVLIEDARHQLFKSIKKEDITEYIYKFITFNILYDITKKQKI